MILDFAFAYLQICIHICLCQIVRSSHNLQSMMQVIQLSFYILHLNAVYQFMKHLYRIGMYNLHTYINQNSWMRRSMMTWNKMRSSILVISFLFAIIFGTLMIHQNATLSAENMRTIFKTSVMWTQNKINGYSGPNVVKLLVLGYPR